MSFCYIILAHTDPEGLRRLIERLRALSPSAHVLVRTSERRLFTPEDITALNAIPLMSDIQVQWGSWSLVEASLEALQVASTQTDAAWFSVISGQDYPMRPLSSWESSVAESGHDVLLHDMEAKPQTWEYTWHSFQSTLPGPRLVTRLANATIDRVAAPLIQRWAELYRLDRTGSDHWWVRRPRAGDRTRPDFLVKASQWLTVSRPVLEAALEEVHTGSERCKYLRSVLIPDEIFLQSLFSAHANSVASATTTAAHFEEDSPSPSWLTPELLKTLHRTGAPFARKVAPQADPYLISLADSLSSDASHTAAPAIGHSSQSRPSRRQGVHHSSSKKG